MAVYNVDIFRQPSGADWLMSFYVKITYRNLTSLHASYNNAPIIWEYVTNSEITGQMRSALHKIETTLSFAYFN